MPNTRNTKCPWMPPTPKRVAKVSVLISVEIDGEHYNLAMNPPHEVDAHQMSTMPLFQPGDIIESDGSGEYLAFVFLILDIVDSYNDGYPVGTYRVVRLYSENTTFSRCSLFTCADPESLKVISRSGKTP